MANAAARVSVALDTAEPRRRTGQLHASKRLRLSIGGFVSQLRAEYLAPQANFTDEGTGPHVILPRRRKALAFRSGGRIIVVRRVNHPGNKGTKWFRKTVSAQAWRRILGEVTS